MPPIYHLDSSVDNSKYFQVKPTWFQGIPKVRGKYIFPTAETYDSSVAVRKSGCTDEELMQKLIEIFLLTLVSYLSECYIEQR